MNSTKKLESKLFTEEPKLEKRFSDLINQKSITGELLEKMKD
jgi:hypothetical protein